MNKEEIIPMGDCIDCGNQYDISYGEMMYFKDKSIPLPKRCSKCRRAKKEGQFERKPFRRYGDNMDGGNISVREDGWQEYGRRNKYNNY